MILLATLGLAAARAISAPTATNSYPTAFFASARPNTALDMIARLPGLTPDTGASVRGLAGAAGNVLIDGERPSTKADTLDNILKRIPATSVVRIDLIRGGAPGIDMQGRPVLANVILLHATGELRRISEDQPFTGSLTLTNDLPRLNSTWTVALTNVTRHALEGGCGAPNRSPRPIDSECVFQRPFI